MAGRAVRGRKPCRDENEFSGVSLARSVPASTRRRLLRLASIAIESARATDSRGVILGISLIRETTRELEADVENAAQWSDFESSRVSKSGQN